MQFWSYQKKGTDKGECMDDVTWSLGGGTTLKLFFRAEDCDKKGEKAVSVLPSGIDEIPPFSLCEVSLVPKSPDPCAEGWGFN
eukprot:682612-Rhodomonas_salina.1